MQGKPWTLTLCDSADRLIGLCKDRDRTARQRRSLEPLEITIEVVQKFRIDVDVFLTLPSEHCAPEDAAMLFEFLASNHVRMASFGYPLLLGRMGIQPATTPSSSPFFSAFLDAWRGSDRALHIEDIQRLSKQLIAARTCPAGLASSYRLSALYFDAEHEYWDADGPIPELRLSGRGRGKSLGRDPGARSRDQCSKSCEYFTICGGEFFGAKYWFNGTLDSALNPYCAVIAKPLFDYLLDLSPSASLKKHPS